VGRLVRRDRSNVGRGLAASSSPIAPLRSRSTQREAENPRERLTLNCRNTRPIARHTAVVSNAQHRVRARVDGRPYHGRSGWLQELERLITDLRRDNVPPGRISVLLLKTPRADEEKHLERMGLRRLSEDDVPHLGSASLQTITWSIVSGFKGLENDVVILAALTDIETD